MWETALPFLGVILGAAIAGGVSLWQVQLGAAKEREAQQAEREQRKKDVRDAFQRETVLAVQDAIEGLRRATDAFTVLGSVDAERYLDEEHALVKKLWARVFDPELQALLGDFRHACWLEVNPSRADQAKEQLDSADSLASQVNDRIAVLLRQLF